MLTYENEHFSSSTVFGSVESPLSGTASDGGIIKWLDDAFNRCKNNIFGNEWFNYWYYSNCPVKYVLVENVSILRTWAVKINSWYRSIVEAEPLFEVSIAINLSPALGVIFIWLMSSDTLTFVLPSYVGTRHQDSYIMKSNTCIYLSWWNINDGMAPF